MIYGFYTKGYKPGGFNPPIAPEFQDDTAFIFDEEEVGSIEFGFKSTLLDGQLQLNGAAFAYDYEGLQVTRIRNNSSINENIDSDIRGLELGLCGALALENLGIDGAFSWLDTEFTDGVTSVDVINKSAGDPDWVNLKNIDPGALTGTNYVVFAPAITPEVLAAAYATMAHSPMSMELQSLAPSPTLEFPLTSQGTSRSSRCTSIEGLLSDISGNSLPNSPETTVRLGVQPLATDGLNGELTMRWDYYRQDDSYGKNLILLVTKSIAGINTIYLSSTRAKTAIGKQDLGQKSPDEDNVTGHYLTSDTSGYFRNFPYRTAYLWAFT